jgi:hypothetical protein
VSLDSIRSSWYKSWCKSASSNHRKAATTDSIGSAWASKAQSLSTHCPSMSPFSPDHSIRFCTHTITTATSANVTTIATAVTDHYHRQYFLSLSRPPQQITASTNAHDTSHRGRTDQRIDNIISRCCALRKQTTDTTNPGDTSQRCRTDHFHSQDPL